jgi:predicted nucleic acid-binding protein
MSVDCFLDTNVIVYAATGRGGENAKRERALDLIETRDFGLSARSSGILCHRCSQDRDSSLSSRGAGLD